MKNFYGGGGFWVLPSDVLFWILNAVHHPEKRLLLLLVYPLYHLFMLWTGWGKGRGSACYVLLWFGEEDVSGAGGKRDIFYRIFPMRYYMGEPERE